MGHGISRLFAIANFRMVNVGTWSTGRESIAVRLGFLGPEGTFSHEAAFGYVKIAFPMAEAHRVDTVAFSTKLDVIEAVARGTVERGIVPIENSIEGSVPETLDGLLRFDEVFIQSEVILPVSQNLMALDGAVISGLTEVWSHPQGIAQCRSWLHQQNVTTTQFSSTAAAAKAVRDSNRMDVAAIANRSAAQVFGLQILKSNLQDEQENHTRFVVLEHGVTAHDQAVKSLLLLTPREEKSGVLASILNVLAALSLNLAWIESRPTKRQLGTYQFFLDVEAGMQEEKIQKAISILTMLGHDVRVLGSYNSIAL